MGNKQSMHILARCGIVIAFVMLSAPGMAQGDLVGHWRFDETNGLIAVDSSVNGNNGVLYNLTGAEWTNGVKRNALSFEKANDYVRMSNSPSLQLTNDLTIALWVKPIVTNGAKLSWIHKSYGGEFSLCHYDSRTISFFQGRQTAPGCYFGATIIPENKIITNVWQHVTVTRNMSTREIKGYLNGMLQNTVIYPDNTNYFPPLATTSPVLIGTGYASGFSGLMDDIIIADYAMTAEEVASLYDSAYLRGWWDMNEGGGLDVEDLSDFGNDGRLTGMHPSASWVDGHPDDTGDLLSALSFTNGFVDCGNEASLQLTNDLSLSLWIRPADLGVRRQNALDKYYCGEFATTLETNGRLSYYHHKFTTVTTWWYFAALPAGTVQTGDWQHIAITRDAATRMIKSYYNGLPVTNAFYPTNAMPMPSANPIKIGKGYAGAFTGEIDKVRIYGRVLTPEEILAMQMLAAQADRNYYTGEEGHAITLLDISALGDVVDNCYLVAKNSAGDEIGGSVTPALITSVPFNSALLPAGTNLITIELHGNNGDQERCACTSINVLKLQPNPGYEIKIDRPTGSVLRDGNPFFPIGFYMAGIDASNTDDFAAVADAGFNTVIHWKFREEDPAVAAGYLQAAANAVSSANPHGLMVIDAQQAYDPLNFASTFKLNPYPYSNFWDAYSYTNQGYLENMGAPYNTSPYTDNNKSIITQAVEYARVESNLLAYYTFDEPLSNQVAAGRDLYAATKSVDGYHPTFCLYSSVIPAGDQYTDWCDILGVDPYWIPPRLTTGGLRASVDWVSKYVCLGKERAVADHKALWVVPMGERWSASHKRSILPAEQYCQTYLALIHGAKGILYFRYPIYHADSWSALTNLCGELTTLAPTVLAPDVPQNVAYSVWSAAAQAYLPTKLNPAANLFTDVQVNLRQATNGNYILLVANARPYPVDAAFTVENLGNAAVNCPFSLYSAMAVNNLFSEELPGYATRAYMFTGALSAPVNIAVQMNPGAEIDPESPPHPVAGRVGKVNLMPNPTLDDAMLVNWPDYCYMLNAYPRVGEVNQAWGLMNAADTPGNTNGLPAGAGPRCLQIVRPEEPYNNALYFRFSPDPDPVTTRTFTFSLYMKADTDDAVRVILGGSSMNGLSVTDTCPTNCYVGNTWQRYECTFLVPNQTNLYQICSPDSFSHQVLYATVVEPGTVWIDAVQLEEAASASAFTTD